MEDKILKLTKLWKDCHFYIYRAWSYGFNPYYRIEHYGYVYKSTNHRRYKTYEAAEKALYREIQKAFRQELIWAKDVIGDCDLYDKIQHDKEEE